MRTDAQKNPRKKNIREQQMHRKNPEQKLYKNRCSDKKTQRKRYKHSVRRQVLQIKTVAGHYANFQYENKSLSKSKEKTQRNR